MRHRVLRTIAVLAGLSPLLLAPAPTLAADPEIDHLLQSPVGKDWVTNGGNLTNQRYSALKQIDTTNVKQLKGAWMTRLKGSGFGGKYSAEATPLVKDGIMYMVTGNDDVFALNAKTGEILWERWSGIDQKISTVCCGAPTTVRYARLSWRLISRSKARRQRTISASSCVSVVSK